ncbi:MAG: hypothetical protein ACYDCC_06820 [Actinomycetota bacterium]
MRKIIALALVAGSMLAGAPAHAAAFSECQAQDAPISINIVRCKKIDASDYLGGVTAFSYFVPSACAAPNLCPVISTKRRKHFFREQLG